VQTAAVVRANLSFVLSAAFLSACASQSGSLPSRAAASSSLGASLALSPHWTRTSIGTFSDPYGVSINPRCEQNCDVFVADPGSKTIWKIAPDGTRSAFGDFSQAGGAFDPQSVTVDSKGNLLIPDKARGGKSKIWFVQPDGNTLIVADLTTEYDRYYRSIAVGPTQADQPGDNGENYYMAVATNVPGILKGAVECSRRGRGACGFGLIKGGPFLNPYGVAADDQGNVYVVDTGTKTAQIYHNPPNVFNPLTNMVFKDPYGIAVTRDGKYVYVADAGAKVVYQRDPSGNWSVVDAFADPYGVAVARDGTLYVADPGSKNVWKLTP
jgi:DNA-binding beta-propeller fold protein YncE